MFKRIIQSCAGVLIGSSALAAEVSGNYRGQSAQGPVAISIRADGDQISGFYRASDGSHALAGKVHGNHVDLLRYGDRPIRWSVQVDDNGLVFTDSGLRLTRVGADQATQPAAATRQAAPDATALARYTAVATTDTGKSFTRDIPSAATTLAALQATFPDLARFFGARPTILGACEDSIEHKSAVVIFAANLNGQAVRGFVNCKLTERGATVVVIFSRSDAPKADWEKLAGGGNEAAANIPLQKYEFPDGTGTVGVAEGWTTRSPTLGGTTIDGPAGQTVLLAAGDTVITPDSQHYRAQLSLQAYDRQCGRPPRPFSMLVSPFSDPATALVTLIPQISQMSERKGGPSARIEKIIHVTPISPMLQGGKASLITYDFSMTTRGVTTKYRGLMQLDMNPIAAGSWGYFTSLAYAPRETFDRDLPTMLAMALSLREDPEAIRRKTAREIDAMNRRFAEMQANIKQIQDAFDARTKAWEHSQLMFARTAANWDELAISTRTVEDTATGRRYDVDSQKIVDGLDRYFPGRYKPIPLRDVRYPLPPGQQ